MSAFPSPARSRFSYPSSPPLTPPDHSHSPSGGERTLPSVRPTATTPPPSHRPVNSLPTPPEDEAVSPRAPPSEAVTLEEGVIDLRLGTDYSRFPDVFQYLKLVGKALGCRKGPLAQAERGRCYLEQCHAENKGPSPPPGPVRYDKATAVQQLPFLTTSIWPKLLEAHLRAIGEAARARLEEYNPAIRVGCRNEQHDRVVKGLTWRLDLTPLDRQTLNGCILLTNIRAPIPKFETEAPVPHSPGYARLISHLYIPQRHPLGYALQQPEYGEQAIMGLLSMSLIAAGFPVVRPPDPKSRYDAPWVNWSHEAEFEYARHHDPGRWKAWTEEMEAEKANPSRELTGYEKLELLLRQAKSWCCHDQPEEYCDECYHEEMEREETMDPGPSERSL
ncbi:hypothetical protein IAT38_000047 [Cryptococcus sp. DSM 104549]